MADNNFFDRISSQGKSYVDGRFTELKLKVVKALSQSLAFVCGMLFFIMVLAIMLGVLALALIQWLNTLVGTPFGTLIVAGFFALLALILFLLRKSLFRSRFVSMFAQLLFDEGSEINSFSDLRKAEQKTAEDIRKCSEEARRTIDGLKVRLSPLNLLAELFEKSSEVIDNAGSVFKSAKALFRNITGRGYSYEEAEYREPVDETLLNDTQNEKDDSCDHPADGDAEPAGSETPRI